MKQVILSAIALSVMASGFPEIAMGQDLIIEAGQGGKNSSQYAETSGQWSDATDAKNERSTAPGLTPGEQCKARKLTTGQAGESRFYPRFTQGGHYCVYVTWPSSANAKQILYVTHTGGNSSAKSCIQNGTGYHNPANGNKWIYLGEWDFKPGGDDYVALVSNGSETTANDPNKPGILFADAVRFTMQPLTGNDGADLFPRDRVEMRALGASVPPGAAVLLTASGVAKPKAGGAAAAAAANAAPAVSASAIPPPTAAITPALPPGVSTPPPSVGVMGSNTATAGAVEWMPSIQQAQQKAASDKSKRILIYFHSPDSQQCMKLDNEILPNPDVSQLLREKYVPVKLDLAQAQEIAHALDVFRAGTLLVYDSAGNGLKKVESAPDAATLIRELQF